MSTLIILKPVVTEKATTKVASNVYTFEVNPDSSKNQIQGALEKMYKVKVATIRTLTRVGKIKRAGRKMVSKQMPARKFAYVKLTSGKFDLFPSA